MERKLSIFVAAGLFLSIALAFLFPNKHPHFVWEQYPFFDTLFTIAGSIVIIALARVLGRFLLQKKEDYYDK
jgi:hypothetical protein